jgi:hypothetical protein
MTTILKISLATVIILILVYSANAEDKVVSDKCGHARLTIVATPYPDSITGNAYQKVTITAFSERKKLKLVFDESKPYRRGEYFSAACIKGKNTKNYIVFQNCCGGSGCNCIGNYGIIDSEKLEVILMPDDMNKDKAAKILGSAPPYSFNLLDSKKAKKPWIR